MTAQLGGLPFGFPTKQLKRSRFRQLVAGSLVIWMFSRKCDGPFAQFNEKTEQLGRRTPQSLSQRESLKMLGVLLAFLALAPLSTQRERVWYPTFESLYLGRAEIFSGRKSQRTLDEAGMGFVLLRP